MKCVVKKSRSQSASRIPEVRNDEKTHFYKKIFIKTFSIKNMEDHDKKIHERWTKKYIPSHTT